MTEIFLIVGSFILLFTIHDFFSTTLSASGAGFLSKSVSIVADRIIQLFARICGRKTYEYHGLFVNLAILLSWLLLIWAGLYLVYSSNPEAISNSSGRPANHWERLYFTGYTLSTLGMGNFKPTTAFFELVTSCFSFFGFIFFTSSMTYFLSVSSAVVKKRTLAKSIHNLGSSPQRIAKKLLAIDASYTYQQLQVLQEMVDSHSVSHQAYPVVHFYSRSEGKDSFSLNITKLDEALTFLLDSNRGENLREELEILRSSLSNFLENIDKNFSRSLPQVERSPHSKELPEGMASRNSQELDERRNVLEKLLRSEGFEWRHVGRQDQVN